MRYEDWRYIKRCIFNYIRTLRSDSDFYVDNIVRELHVYLTGSAHFIINATEINLLINHLCT